MCLEFSSPSPLSLCNGGTGGRKRIRDSAHCSATRTGFKSVTQKANALQKNLSLYKFNTGEHSVYRIIPTSPLCAYRIWHAGLRSYSRTSETNSHSGGTTQPRPVRKLPTTQHDPIRALTREGFYGSAPTQLTRTERLGIARYTEGLTRTFFTLYFAGLVYWNGVMALHKRVG